MNKQVFLASSTITFLLLSLSTFSAEKLSQTDEIKTKILNAAEQYRGQVDKDGTKRASLDLLINQLLSITPEVPIETKVKNLEGAWDQVWGPYDFDRLEGFELDADNMYQVIFPNGYYYNIGFSKFYGQKTTGFVRGEYQINGDKLQVRFTENKFSNGFIPSNISLVELGILKEADFINTTDVPGGISNIPAYLNEVYVDKDLRITYGGRSYNDSDNDLYVLKRIQQVK